MMIVVWTVPGEIYSPSPVVVIVPRAVPSIIPVPAAIPAPVAIVVPRIVVPRVVIPGVVPTIVGISHTVEARETRRIEIVVIVLVVIAAILLSIVLGREHVVSLLIQHQTTFVDIESVGLCHDGDIAPRVSTTVVLINVAQRAGVVLGRLLSLAVDILLYGFRRVFRLLLLGFLLGNKIHVVLRRSDNRQHCRHYPYYNFSLHTFQHLKVL